MYDIRCMSALFFGSPQTTSGHGRAPSAKLKVIACNFTIHLYLSLAPSISHHIHSFFRLYGNKNKKRTRRHDTTRRHTLKKKQHYFPSLSYTLYHIILCSIVYRYCTVSVHLSGQHTESTVFANVNVPGRGEGKAQTEPSISTFSILLAVAPYTTMPLLFASSSHCCRIVHYCTSPRTPTFILSSCHTRRFSHAVDHPLPSFIARRQPAHPQQIGINTTFQSMPLLFPHPDPSPKLHFCLSSASPLCFRKSSCRLMTTSSYVSSIYHWACPIRTHC